MSEVSIQEKPHVRIPDWLRRHLPKASAEPTRQLIKDLNLNTVCLEARCPNLQECYSRKVATFMVAGKDCTRACSFCSIDTRKPVALESHEPARVAEAAYRMGLLHVVITMVARDDLSDGGAQHVARTIEALRSKLPETSIEVLTSDFQGREDSIRIVCEASPEVFNHNVETVRRLSPSVRSRSDHDRSLGVLNWVAIHYSDMKTKSGLMLGLGEREEEVTQTLRELKEVGVKMVTLGQYLQPERRNRPVTEFIHPDQFAFYAKMAKEMGFLEVASGPFVRSSYNARESFIKVSTS